MCRFAGMQVRGAPPGMVKTCGVLEEILMLSSVGLQEHESPCEVLI